MLVIKVRLSEPRRELATSFDLCCQYSAASFLMMKSKGWEEGFVDRFQYELLKSVKEKYERAGGHAEYECEQSGPDKSARQFYVRNLRDNFVRSMDSCHEEQYRRGSGRELDDKMRALRSSSAMTFNLIGNKYCVIDENELGLPHGRYSVEYEHQVPTLKIKGGAPANIDAWLESDRAGGVVIAFELKMMEWLTSSSSLLKDKYLDPANYSHGVGDVFAGLAEKLKLERFVRYDWAQMFKHTVALMNEMLDRCCGERISTLVLLNVVWEPVRPTLHQAMTERYYEMLLQEHGEFARFKEIMEPAKALFMDLCGVDFSIEYRNAFEFAHMIQRDDAEWPKLERYF